MISSGLSIPTIIVLTAAFVVAISTVTAQTNESHPGIVTSYERFATRDGLVLQAIITKPENVGGRLPAILFVQWLSCDTIAISSNPRDGWSAMLRRVVRESKALVWRTEKRGVGLSQGNCATMDYETELSDHREALVKLRQRADVDPQRIFILGGSIGGTYAPLLAADQALAGVIVWGAGATTWTERMMKFERNALELRGIEPKSLAAEMNSRFQFLNRYLIEGETPAEIAASNPELGKVWSRLVGTSAASHYGRPVTFHQQAQRADWAGAWSRVKVPVLAMYGEYDWFESRDATTLIARIVNKTRPGSATFVEIPRMNHHFAIYPTPEDAFAEENGTVNPDPAVDVMLSWLGRLAGNR
jgi:pimeloyl-ACP methyl ester carboxylesterase